MSPLAILITYCVLIACAAFTGGLLPSLLKLTHTRMQVIMSFVGGLVLGIGLLHLLPHSVASTGSMDATAQSALIGLLVMFFLIRIFHVHQHGPVDDDHKHDPECVGAHHHHDYPTTGEKCDSHNRKYGWIGLALGLSLHTLIDGMALAASVMDDAEHHAEGDWALFGLGTFCAIFLHKPLDGMSIATVMAAGNWPIRNQRIVSGVFALMCSVGALAFYFGLRQMGDQSQMVLGCALGVAAGVFLCISLADILPEIQFHTHDRVKLSAALLLGLALAYGIGFLESGHQHGGPHQDNHQHQGHSHQGHSHQDHSHQDHDH